MSDIVKEIVAICNHIKYHNDISCALEATKELLATYPAEKIHQIEMDMAKETILMKLCTRIDFGNIYEKFVDLLVASCPDVNQVDANGNSALFYAVKALNLYAVRSLVKAGADVSLLNKKEETALMLSSGRGIDGEELVDFLIKVGSPLNYQDETGETALMKAAKTGDFEKLKKLVDAGAILDVQDYQGQTALMKALRYRPKGYEGDERVAAQMSQVLLKNGADPEIEDHEGRTALDFATGFYLKTAFSNTLFKIKKNGQGNINQNKLNDMGNELKYDLLQKIYSNSTLDAQIKKTVAKQIILTNQQKNQTVDKSNVRQNQFLLMNEAVECAIKNQRGEKIIELFLKGVSFAGFTKEGKSVLDLAYETKNEAVLTAVLKLSDKNQINAQGDSLLIRAVKEKDKSVVKQLLAQDVDLCLKDKEGKDAFNIAMGLGDSELTQLIKEAAVSAYHKKKIALQIQPIHLIDPRQKD
ncbi:MAG: ankyrin repeat domain-containing protein [Alphaproteobacteria bacterium]|nr:ankyrin repeat domain-containing protein [Alphaproteobacteria bacterium]